MAVLNCWRVILKFDSGLDVPCIEYAHSGMVDLHACAGLLEAKAFLDKASMLDALIGHLDVCPKRDCFGWQGLADEIEQQHLDAQNQASQVSFPYLPPSMHYEIQKACQSTSKVHA